MNRCIFDCHSHTFLCGHAEMVGPRVYHALADAKGFKGYAFCCHNPFVNDDVTPEYRMPFKQFKTFLNMFQIEKEFASQRFPDLELTLNMEVDYHPDDPQKTKQFVDQAQDFDCLLGSLHYYRELSQVNTQDQVQFIKKYVNVWKGAVKTGWFNIMSHYDFFKAIFGMDWYLEHFQEFKDVLEEGLEFLGEFNQQRLAQNLQPVCLEMNTGGLQYGCDPFLPTEQLIKKAIQLNIPICLGSDAHQAHEVGRLFLEALTLLKENGCTELHYFKQKIMQSYSVEDAINSLTNIEEDKVLTQFKMKNPDYGRLQKYMKQ